MIQIKQNYIIYGIFEYFKFSKVHSEFGELRTFLQTLE